LQGVSNANSDADTCSAIPDDAANGEAHAH
jgi:hypothetical protein